MMGLQGTEPGKWHIDICDRAAFSEITGSQRGRGG
jgi:hypothetical protein